MTSPSSFQLEKGSQKHGCFRRAAVRYEVMRLMSASVQSTYRFAPVRIRLVQQKESGDGPNGIQFGLSVDQMLKISGNLHVRNDAPQSVRRKVRHGYNMRRVHFTSGRSTQRVQFHGK